MDRPAITDKQREQFEEGVFRERFLASIKRNPSPPSPKISGALDFVSVDCPDKAELMARNENGDYKDEAVSAMWFGYQLACAATPATTALSFLIFKLRMGQLDREAVVKVCEDALAKCKGNPIQNEVTL